MKISNFFIGLNVHPRYKKRKPEHKQFIRIGCAALALTLAIGTVPFMRSFAAEEEAAVSGSDMIADSEDSTTGQIDSNIVSGTDAAVIIAGETVEPNPTYGYSASGYCGEGESVSWSLDPDGNLTIRGTGAMTSIPWKLYLDYIFNVVIENGVTNIKNNAFSGCSSLTSVVIPSSVTSIEEEAFKNCSALTSVDIPNGV